MHSGCIPLRGSNDGDNNNAASASVRTWQRCISGPEKRTGEN